MSRLGSRVALLLVVAVLCAAAGMWLYSRAPNAPGRHFSERLVILGFDGMDPRLVQRWLAEGKLPNIKRMIERGGGVYPLATTTSPESPTAWASFATGVNPGKHNIFDFLVRDTTTYLPDLGMVRREPGRFLFGYVPIARPKISSIRGGTSFWVEAGRAGVRSSVLTVPVTFPPEDVPNGELLAGLPLPDIRGTMGTFSYFATDLSRYEEGNTEFGGILRRLVVEKDGDHDVARTELVGPPDPIVRQRLQSHRGQAPLSETDRKAIAELQAREYVRIPIVLRWDRAGKTAAVEIGGTSIRLEQGKMSRWVDLDFRVNFLIRLHGMAQLLLVNADNELQLYVSPVNWKPDRPPVPISSPASFSGRLFAELGYFRTLGWAEATWPLNEGRMDEATFMEDLFRAFDDRARVILNRIDSRRWDLLVGVIESTDRVQHMMWRFMDPAHPMHEPALAAKFGDAIERVYRRADQFVGDVVNRVDPGTTVLIVSDHGFHSWRKAVNLNTWLVEQGYMVLEGQPPGDKTLGDLFGGGEFWENVDWTRTRAYAMGLGQIYFNLRGREARGVVSPGIEAAQLASEISTRLLAMKDPDDGSPIVRAVYKRDDVYAGDYVQNAAELQVGMEDGYRVSWQTTLGGSPQGLVYPNMKKWSGDHGGFDVATTPGVLIASRPIVRASASILDIAPTVLEYFGDGFRTTSMAMVCSSRVAVLAVLLSAAVAGQAPPQSESARAEAAAQRIAERIKVLQRESDSLATQERTLLTDLRALEVERQLRAAELERAQAELERTREALAKTTERTASLRRVSETERPDVEARLVRLYKMGHAGYWRLLLDIDDLRSIGRAYRTASAMTEIDGARIREHRRTLEQLDQERRALEQHTKEAAAIQERAARAQKGVERAVAARTALVASIDAHRDLNAQLTGELEAAQQRLQTAISQFASGRATAIDVPLRPFRGALSWPAQGVVTGRFGRQQAGPGVGLIRNGIEISVAEGQPVRSVHGGTVAFADPFTGYGNLVIIDHGDGAYSLYGHLGTIVVTKGARVDTQDRLGGSGRNPAGNPALYFELRIDGKPVDPLQWLKR